MRSPIYWHPSIYCMAMKLLYGKHFNARYKAIAELIPENARVVEVCAGDGYLYGHYLRKKNIDYTGLDINPVFVRAGQKNKFQFLLHDLSSEDLPSAEYVIIQASLYQFIPEENRIIRKLLAAAQKKLIIAEPVKNLADSKNLFVRFFAKYSANPGSSHATKRFNKDSLIACFKQYPEFREAMEIEGGREMIGVFGK